VFVEINKDLLKKTDIDLDKRWFRDVDRECDLFTWQNDENKIVRFQFWIDESLLEWNIDKGFKTGKLDQNTGAFRSYQAPMFHYHSNSDNEILNTVTQLIKGDVDEDKAEEIFDSVYDELAKISR
jgi:hypothetical protein